MILNAFKIAWRSLLNNKVYAIINIGGLAIGIAAAIIISLWVKNEFSYDDYFTNKSSIASVIQHQSVNGEISSSDRIPIPLEKALRDNYCQYFKYLALSSDKQSIYLNHNNTSILKTGNYIQPDITKILNLEFIRGEQFDLEDINSILLSVSTAKNLFGNINCIGKQIIVNADYNMTVAGIYKDIPNNSSFKDLNFIMPWNKYKSIMPWIKESANNWGNNSFSLFVQVSENTSIKSISDIIKNVKKELSKKTAFLNPELELLPMKDWHLKSDFKNGKQVGEPAKIVFMFQIIGLFILLLAFINFVNLSTASSGKRAKEVGLKKTIGAYRIQLIFQFLCESFVIVSFAYTLGCFIVFLSLNAFNNIAKKEILFPYADYHFWIFSVLFIIITTLISGSYPAFFLSSFKPIDTLKGTFTNINQKGFLRKFLVTFQFTISIILIVITMVISAQINHAKNRTKGYNQKGLIQIATQSPAFKGKYKLMYSEWLKSGAITEMSASTSPTTDLYSTRTGFTWKGKLENFMAHFGYNQVSLEYAKSLHLEIIEGGDFSNLKNAVLINETALKYMDIKNPIGKFITNTGNKKKYQITGVIKDVVTQNPFEPVKQTLYVFDKDDYSNYYNFYNLRLNPNKKIDANLSIIKQVFKKHFPDVPFVYDFVEDKYNQKFTMVILINKLSFIFTLLAIFISTIGLIGLASFITTQRKKEIGIRKILGSSVFKIWINLYFEFFKLTIIASCIAIPITYYFLDLWLSSISYRIYLSAYFFLWTFITIITISFLTVSYHVIKAAYSNPVKNLISE